MSQLACWVHKFAGATTWSASCRTTATHASWM